MATNIQTIKDRNHTVIGYIETRPNGTQEAKNAKHSVVGSYDPGRNETKDATHRVIGYGNLLATLIH